MDRSFRANAALLSSPYKSLWATQTEGDHRHTNYRVEYLLQASWMSPLFPFQVTKNERQVMKPLYDRYRLVKQILSRANTIPIIVSRTLFVGYFFGFKLRKQESPHFCLNTVTKSQPPLSLKDQANEWSMTHFTLKLGKACQGTLVPTCEPQGTSHLVLFLLFPLGCCCYFIHPLFGTASLLFPYQPMLSCRSSMLLGSTGLYVQASCTQNIDLSRSHRWCQACPWMKERALSLLTLNLY